MKLLFLVSSLDLTKPFSATPAWWQLMKGLYEIGVEVIATPYEGPAVETLWWRAKPNPGKVYGDAFQSIRETIGKRISPPAIAPKPTSAGDPAADKFVRRTAQTLIAPLWLKHLDRILKDEPDIDAVIVLTAPLNHLVGVAGELQRRHNKPIFYYDGDVPASLPHMNGFASGFHIYQGADLAEYTAFISNSAGGAAAIKELGARAVHPLFYGADPDVFSPVGVPQDIDVFFYGHGREYRDEWIDAMITKPSKALPGMRFAVRGTKLGNIGKAKALPYLSFSKLREYACRSLINLCITRAAHANVFASSSARPFELASMGCCIVANPYVGIETWFEPGKEIFVVQSGEEAMERYRYLRTHDSERLAVGNAARERVLKEHTFRHRAQELCAIVKQYT
jgi:glycosyltransferase involved in cell wall biosynthesis